MSERENDEHDAGMEFSAFFSFDSEAKSDLNSISKTEMLIGKGHLLTEKWLTRIIEELAPNYKAIENEKYSFEERWKLAQMLIKDSEEDQDKWEAVKALNELRNRIFHFKKDREMEMKQKIDNFFEKLLALDGVWELQDDLVKTTGEDLILDKLHTGILKVAAFLHFQINEDPF